MAKSNLKREFRTLELAKESLEAIFDGIQDGIAVLDNDFNIIRLNKAMLLWLEKEDFKDVLGNSCFKLIPTLSDVIPKDKVKNICQAGEPYYSSLPLHLFKNRNLIFEPCLFPIRNDMGSCGLILYLRDVTKRMNVQSQLIELERYKNLGPLAAGIAHQLRNPLTVIQSLAQLTLADQHDKNELKENLESIVHHSKLANKVVKELINFSKPAEFKFDMISIQEVINETSDLIKSRCRKGKIKLVKEIDESLPQTKIDREHMMQVLFNLSLNAIDAMDKGGNLYLRAKDKEGKIQIEIEDTGKGMSKFNVEHAFDMFYTTKKQGVGYGLFVSKQIVQSHQGEIYLQSEEKKGTKVIILIPIVGSALDKWKSKLKQIFGFDWLYGSEKKTT